MQYGRIADYGAFIPKEIGSPDDHFPLALLFTKTGGA
jgi:hypothetical protein